MNAITSLVSLALLWILFFWFYKDYRLDKFRQSLFALRDELFDLAADGKLSFSSPAYGILRSTINGNIQFGHYHTIVDMLVFHYLFSVPESETKAYLGKWNNSLSELDEETQKSLKKIRDRLHINVLEQIVLTSALLMFTVVVALFWLLLSLLQKLVFEHVRRFVNRRFVANLMAKLDSFAFAQMSHN